MTTLIIHPTFKIQKNTALQIVTDLLGTQLPETHEILHPDLHILDGTTSSSIGIEDIRSLIKRLQFHPYQAPYQIGLILMASALTEEAQNSLLKTLEEPAEQTKYILTTPHERYLLPTILSRSKKLYVEEEFESEPEKIRISEPEDSKEAGKKEPDTQIPSADDFLRQSTVDQFLLIEKLAKIDSDEPGTVHELLANLITHFREQLLSATRDGKDDLRTQARQAVRLINRAVHYISKNANKRLTLENLVLQLDQLNS